MNTPSQPVPGAERCTNPVSGLAALRNSMRVHYVLLRFSTISLSTALLDNVVFYLVFHFTGTILGAQAVARTASVFVNYKFVRQTVFFSDRGHHVLLPRYLALVFVNALLSYAGIRFLTAVTPLSVIASKIVSETLLFAANFAVQKAFIFNRRPPLPEQASGL